MWTSKIILVEQDPDASLARITVEYYKDGVLVDTQIHRTGEIQSLEGLARQQIVEYARRDVVANFIANPPIGQSAIPELVPPTEEELKAKVYQFKKEELYTAKKDLDLGIIDQATFDKKKAAVLAVTPIAVADNLVP